ncbi:restriction endonuclease subunit S [Escherichia coli]|uniref:restriction endonuclease subunit S n=2 Tax=Escherichia coli TaxID=562 RepID=UPI001D19115D|nr:restriction endonuclease subunit S [Escherichia coli]EGK3618779.1 restriction endonuclease subunit S [Escherichia coli]MCA7312341.1 restriction endonuclease subunit S [Escherichia coli]MCC4133875.1 restriction endonuclease subunit S [Escherichia coli]MCC4143210.1 restriction endonuclease subunit S [Escherichia coli]MCY0740580.1 restriction endonuclease subunit S [Escherichia coli]
MSEMSYLEKLLDGVEVEWLPLGHIAAIKTGQSVNKNMISKNPGVYPVINSGREPLGFINTWNTDNDPIGITTRGAGVGSVIWQEGKYFRGNLNYSITIDKKNHINIRYMYHALLHMKNDIHELCTFDGIPALNAGSLKKLLIPIPCPDNPEKSLAIQSEIVRILDKFTALTAELTAELNMRKKQYNYYRDQLLSFKEGEVEWKTLGEIGDFTYGYAAKAMDSGDARFVRITDINKDGKLSKENPMYVELNEENEKYTLDKNDLLMARTGATFGKTMIFEEDYPAVYAGFLIKLNLNKTIINAKYYWHFAQSDFFWEQANKLVSGGGQPQFNANALKQVRVPIPYPSHPQKSLDEQGRIVDILDKFDAIAASITEGLPREIELRQKQYEYYRDLLLSFPKPETVSK